MLRALDSFIICTRFKMKNFIEDFRKEEMGVSAFVATVLILLITVLLCAVFWKSIQKWWNDIADKIFDTANDVGNGDLTVPN